MSKLFTVFGFAAATCVATVAMGWPRNTFADPLVDGVADSSEEQVFDGEIVQDHASKTGWAVKITYENRGTEEATFALNTEVHREQIFPASRVSPMGKVVWMTKDKVTVAAHESVVKSYAVPAWLARQLSATEKETSARALAKNNPFLAKPYTRYTVDLERARG